MPPKQSPQAFKWVFTIHSGHLKKPAATLTSTLAAFSSLKVGDDNLKYLVVQHEKGEGTEREHLQGFIMFSKVVRPTTLRRLYGVEEHAFQRAKGSPDQNRIYCSKDESRLAETSTVEVGSCPGGQGSRSDLKRMADKIESDGLESAIDEYPHTFMQYSKGAKELDTHYKRKRTSKPRDLYVNVFFGTPGSGKSHFAQLWDEGNSWTLPVQSKNSPVWFDGYAGQRTLIIEDFEPSVIPFRTLLRILDEGPLQVKISGGFIPAEWQHVILTSNDAPHLWYAAERGDYWKMNKFGTEGPLQRRIHTILEFKGVYPDTTYVSKGLSLDFPRTLQEIWDLQEQADPSPPSGPQASQSSSPVSDEEQGEVPGGDYQEMADWLVENYEVTDLTDLLAPETDMQPMRPAWIDDEAEVLL